MRLCAIHLHGDIYWRLHQFYFCTKALFSSHPTLSCSCPQLNPDTEIHHLSFYLLGTVILLYLCFISPVSFCLLRVNSCTWPLICVRKPSTTSSRSLEEAGSTLMKNSYSSLFLRDGRDSMWVRLMSFSCNGQTI